MAAQFEDQHSILAQRNKKDKHRDGNGTLNQHSPTEMLCK